MLLQINDLPQNARFTNLSWPSDTYIGQFTGPSSPVRRQAIIWTNSGILLTRPFRTYNDISKTYKYQKRTLVWKQCLQNGGQFVSASVR